MNKLIIGLSLVLCAATAQAQAKDNCDLEKAAKTAVIKSETGIAVSKCTTSKAMGIDDAKDRIDNGKEKIKNKKEGLNNKVHSLKDNAQDKAETNKKKLNNSLEKTKSALESPVSAAVQVLTK